MFAFTTHAHHREAARAHHEELVRRAEAYRLARRARLDRRVEQPGAEPEEGGVSPAQRYAPAA
ncbi:hypothetical protein ACH4E8_01000 [Streptomyces sp. NPDC017979]|uniref:hypothetical protein n=1 Tax=unclassified Streptomyces TaxID=2593676 RepID=UPI0037B7837D